MGVSAGCAVPHPPIIVREVGGARTAEVEATVEAMRRLAGRLAQHDPESLVIMSPHSPYLPHAVPVRTDSEMDGSFAAFRAGQVRFQTLTDSELADAILARAEAQSVPMVALTGDDVGTQTSMYGRELDHGVLVPLYFLRETIDVPIVNLGLSFLGYDVHYRVGMLVHEVAEQLGRKVAFVASGDLSHRLIPGAPAGFDPRGAELDEQIVGALRDQDFDRLQHLDPELVEAGGECGLRSIVALTGCFAGRRASCEVMSYEGPFGVGYLVAYMGPAGQDAGVK